MKCYSREKVIHSTKEEEGVYNNSLPSPNNWGKRGAAVLERGYGIQFVRSSDFESVDKI